MSKVLDKNAGYKKGGNPAATLAAKQLAKGSLSNKIKTYDSENHIKNIPGIPEVVKQFKQAEPKKLNNKSFIENHEDSFYIAVAIALKSVLRYIWELIVISAKSIYRLFSDLILTPIFIFLPYVFDVLAIIIVTICLILLIIYLISGGSKRQPNNMFDNIFNGFKGLLIPKVTLYDKNKVDDYTPDASSIFTNFTNIGDIINESIFKRLLRTFVVNPNLDDISENDKHVRIHKKEGRCDNLGLIESKDGRYCYEQLDKKHIEWNDQEIPYRLLERKDIKNKKDNTHYDYYVPNCKGSNLFTREFIKTCKDSKRTQFVCEL